MKIIKAVISALIALTLSISLNSKFGDIPPLGKFLDPFRGFWKNAESKKLNAERDFRIDGLRGNVEIKFDDTRNSKS